MAGAERPRTAAPGAPVGGTGPDPPGGRPRWLDRRPPELAGRSALTRHRIVLAALHLVETQGLEALTMRRVAATLQVTPMSLYNHVADKAELVDVMTDFLVGGVVEASATDGGDWEQRLRALVRRAVAMWREHPGLVRVYTDGVTLGPNGRAAADLALALLGEAGFERREAAAAYTLLFRWSVSALLVAAPGPAEDRDVEFGLDVIIGGLKAALAPA